MKIMGKAFRMVAVHIHVPAEYLRWLDQLVGKGRYPNRSEAIRMAVRDLLRSEGTWGAQVSGRLYAELFPPKREG